MKARDLARALLAGENLTVYADGYEVVGWEAGARDGERVIVLQLVSGDAEDTAEPHD
jgi:uncharacterized protein YebE (UPF0316 family)